MFEILLLNDLLHLFNDKEKTSNQIMLNIINYPLFYMLCNLTFDLVLLPLEL